MRKRENGGGSRRTPPGTLKFQRSFKSNLPNEKIHQHNNKIWESNSRLKHASGALSGWGVRGSGCWVFSAELCREEHENS